MSPGLIAAGAAGGAVLLLTLTDVLLTIFNYDGFTFLTARFHRLLWAGLRGLASVPPSAGRDKLLAVGSAALLPADQPLTGNPYLLALADEYTTTVRRLQRSFVGPPHDPSVSPLPKQDFWDQYRRAEAADPFVRAFLSLQDEATEHSGLAHDLAPPRPARTSGIRNGCSSTAAGGSSSTG